MFKTIVFEGADRILACAILALVVFLIIEGTVWVAEKIRNWFENRQDDGSV